MISKQVAYDFFLKNESNPINATIDEFVRLYPEFDACDRKNLYRRLQKLYSRATALIKNKKKKGNEEKRNELLKEPFLPGQRAEEGNDTGGGEHEMSREELISYINELEQENRRMREIEGERLVEAQRVIESYDDALDGMERLAGEAEENYDEILRIRDESENENELSAANKRMEELEVKYAEQSMKLKSLEKQVKFYKDEKVQHRDWRHKKVMKEIRMKLRISEKTEQYLKEKVEKLMEEKDNALNEISQQEEKLNEILRKKRSLEKKCSDWKGKAKDVHGENKEKLEKRDDEIDEQWLRIRKLERENRDMRELIDTFEASEVATFEEGRYIDVIRNVIMKLHELKLSTRSIAPAIKIITEDLCGMKVERLPAYGTMNKLMYEAKFIALLNAGRASLKEKQGDVANFLLNDGTTKLKKKYNTKL